MKSTWIGMVICLTVLGAAGTSFGVVIDFAGGTATLSDASTVTTTNTGLWQDVVDYYAEDGMTVDFIGAFGTIGDYYSINGLGPYNNSVIHAHWQSGMTSIVFAKADGSTFDLNYVDITSNCVTGGSQADGTERSFITTSGGYSMLLPSSDWGFDFDYYGEVGDGVARLWLDDNFDGITSFTITSENAYCFGMDNFYIDEPAPPAVPVPGSLLLTGIGLAALARKRRTA
ncbi:MAG: PEP-CTERM sorting domain-containing protein [Phycisphaerales bacterium]